ncbi:hypothetical protein ALGA_1945 [Labilibaculum antarcticum]|uniref:Uncharacterized protein n=1 Tax=Labilibaculum antarcticum TaxID=1717717 RepID=A0A1Y1CIZ5_9BACT|nr:hypothetical protein ALGA_1945 [Labilibaculum antarcticum]
MFIKSGFILSGVIYLLFIDFEKGKKVYSIHLKCKRLNCGFVLNRIEVSKEYICNWYRLDAERYNERVEECRAAVDAITPSKLIAQLGELGPA